LAMPALAAGSGRKRRCRACVCERAPWRFAWRRCDAIIRVRAAGEIGNASAGDHGLGGRAAFIDAGAADVNFFDESGTQAGVGQRLAKGAVPPWPEPITIASYAAGEA